MKHRCPLCGILTDNIEVMGNYVCINRTCRVEVFRDYSRVEEDEMFEERKKAANKAKYEDVVKSHSEE